MKKEVGTNKRILASRTITTSTVAALMVLTIFIPLISVNVSAAAMGGLNNDSWDNGNLGVVETEDYWDDFTAYGNYYTGIAIRPTVNFDLVVDDDGTTPPFTPLWTSSQAGTSIDAISISRGWSHFSWPGLLQIG